MSIASLKTVSATAAQRLNFTERTMGQGLLSTVLPPRRVLPFQFEESITEQVTG